MVSEPSGKVITQAIDEGITNPQLLSTMITTAIGKWGQIKIAGESIQRRLGSENIIDLMKNYDYPNETDYVILGEINTLSKNYEIDFLFVNDGSTDDTKKCLINEFKGQCRIISYNENRGPGHAFKIGFKAAKGDIIITSDDDCTYSQDTIPEILSLLTDD